MNYRTVKLLALENLGEKGTKTLDLNVRDPITSLNFEVKYTVVADATRDNPEYSIISNIEIVDGSDVLMELTGEQMVAFNFYEGREKKCYLYASNFAASRTFRMSIPFGRFFLDEMLALDPSRFRNPQIKITYDAENMEGGGTVVQLAIIAECFDEKVIAPIGFLRHSLLHSYVGSNGTYSYIDLPTDLLIRKLYLQTRKWAGSTLENLGEIKLSEDNDKRIPFDLTAEEWAHKISMEFGEIEVMFAAMPSGDTYPMYLAPCHQESINAISEAANQYIYSNYGGGGRFTFVAAATDQAIKGSVRGYIPFWVWCYAFGNQQDMADWYDVTKVGSLRLRIKAGTAGATTTYNTLLQQLRRY